MRIKNRTGRYDARRGRIVNPDPAIVEAFWSQYEVVIREDITNSTKAALHKTHGYLNDREVKELIEDVSRTARLTWDQFCEEVCSSENIRPSPPINAQFLFDLFLPDDVCESFLGDLQERYNTKLKRLGKARADWWYRKQVITSMWPLAVGAGRRISISSVGHIGAFVLRLSGFPGLAEALKRAVEEERKRTS